jgi:hypothetical protein
MNANIKVTADGHVHVGGNQWASLEEIQQAVLDRQSSLTANGDCPHCRLQEEVFDYARSSPTKKRQVMNAEPEAPLELPSTLRVNKDEQKRKPAANAEECLPLPSTLRR